MQCTNLTYYTECFNIYLKEIRGAKVLTPEDEKEIFNKIAGGDPKAINELFNRTAKFAIAVAKTYTNDSTLLEDLIQEANIGILEAIPLFDITKGYRFISFAVWHMKDRISHFMGMSDLVNNTNGVKYLAKVKQIKKDFYNKNQRYPSDYEVMDILESQGTLVKDVKYLHKVCMSSIDTQVGDNDDSDTLADVGVFADKTASQVDYLKEIEKEDIEYQVSQKLSVLTDREKRFIKAYYGFDGVIPMDFKAIANLEQEITGKKIGAERVRQIINGAIQKMK